MEQKENYFIFQIEWFISLETNINGICRFRRCLPNHLFHSMATPKLSSAGWAFITGLAILANPRVIPGSKTVVIDTQLYIGPTDDDLIIGSLRYFNSANLTFHDGPHLYAIVATVSILSSFSRQQIT